MPITVVFPERDGESAAGIVAALAAAQAAEVAAELAETNAETAQAAALVSQTAAATSAATATTQAATATTQASAASASAATATTKADEAAASAATASAAALVAGGIGYAFSSATTAGDPGAGVLRASSATLASVTALYVDNVDGAGNSQTTWLTGLGLSDNATKGILTISSPSTGASVTFEVTGVVDSTGYRTISVQNGSGALPTNGAAIKLSFARSGDSAAAEAIAADTENLRLAEVRYRTEISSGRRAMPATLPLLVYNWTLSSGTRNANGTITLPAGATLTSPNLNNPILITTTPMVAYVTATTPTAAGDIQLQAQHAGTVFAAFAATTAPKPGVAKLAWTYSGAPDYVTFTVKNNTGADLTIYDEIEMYAASADNAYLPQVYPKDGVEPVQNPWRIVDWNEISPMARWAAQSHASKRITENDAAAQAANSSAANDLGAGLRYSPKQNVSALSAASAGGTVLLARGSHWVGQDLATALGTTTQGVVVADYTDGFVDRDFALLDGGEDLTALTWTQDGANLIWSATIACQSTVIANDGYDFATVVQQVDADAVAMPWGSQSLMTIKNSLALLRSGAAGAMYATKPTSTTITYYVKPLDGLAPGTGAYSFRGTTRRCVVDWIAGNDRQSVATNFAATQCSFGYGCVSAGPQTFISGFFVAFGGTHLIKMEAGEICNGIVYDVGSGGNSGNCYISPNADGYSWFWHDMLFYGSKSPLYSHVAAGEFETGEYSHIWATLGRQANGSMAGDAAAAVQVAKTLESWNFWNGFSTNGQIGNSAFPTVAVCEDQLLDLSWFKTRDTTRRCLVKVRNWSDPDNVNNRGSKCFSLGLSDTITECTILAVNDDVSATAATGDYRATVLDVIAAGLAAPSIRRCLVVIDTQLTTNGTYLATGDNPALYDADEMVFVFLNEGDLFSNISGGPTRSTWASFLSDRPTQHLNSVAFDWRGHPLGRRAIFRDPDNWDFRPALTPEAALVVEACMDLGAGCPWVPQTAPIFPTVDEAYRMLRRYS